MTIIRLIDTVATIRFYFCSERKKKLFLEKKKNVIATTFRFAHNFKITRNSDLSGTHKNAILTVKLLFFSLFDYLRVWNILFLFYSISYSPFVESRYSIQKSIVVRNSHCSQCVLFYGNTTNNNNSNIIIFINILAYFTVQPYDYFCQ